jgi:hypothetical protein
MIKRAGGKITKRSWAKGILREKAEAKEAIRS